MLSERQQLGRLPLDLHRMLNRVSDEGVGTTVSLVLPAAPAQGPLV